eukprot:GFUD01045325.1.p1 GENE.GFUD01045325.1~~GFUD01045325.1.p1  ORF type:complete len:112 (+),score=20.78 GFUD01045325.1:87-422(+)
MMSHALFTISFLSLISSSPLPFPDADPIPHSDCVEYRELALPICTYGGTTNHCGQATCLKGPGQICGGSYGQCADNLLCSLHSRCEGCSFRTFKCWDNDMSTNEYYIDINI